MLRASLLAVLCALASSTASAQDEVSLEGGSRISLQGGWRYAANTTFYDRFYSRSGGLERAPSSRGGPVGALTFAYSVKDAIELGIDLFGYFQQIELTGQPRLTTAAYGAQVGLRFQTKWDLGPYGMVPFVGIHTGPLLASASFEGQQVRETFSQAWAASAGATLRLAPRWGLCLEYRFVAARGAVGHGDARFGSFNAGGSWLTAGVTYNFARETGRPLDRSF